MNGVSLLILTLRVASCPHGEYELQARSLASNRRPQSRDGLFSNRYPNPSKVLLINTRDVRDRFLLMKFVALLISITYQKWFFIGETGGVSMSWLEIWRDSSGLAGTKYCVPWSGP